MRITQNILINNFLRNLNSISARIERTQQQLATGVKYSRPSHGPIEVSQVVGFQSAIARIGQYVKNVDDGVSQVGYIDTIMQAVIADIGRARDLSLDGANDNLNQADRRAIGQEINLILESTLSNANSQFRDRYTFAGWQTRTVPFEAVLNARTGCIEDIIYHGDRGRIDRLVGEGDQLAVNVSGKHLFLEQTYTLKGRILPSDVPLGFEGTLTLNEVDFLISPEQTLTDIALMLNAASGETQVFASISDSRLVLESAAAVSEFTISDNRSGRLLENLGLRLMGAFNTGMYAPTLPIVDSTPAIFVGAGPVANLTYDETNNCLNIFLGADANDGVSKSANIFITPGTYASVADLITELQTQIDAAFGANRIKVSDAGGGVLQIETVATGDEIDPGDLVIGGPVKGYDDTASDSADLNLVAVVGNAPPTPAGIAGTDGNDKIIIDLGPTTSKNGLDVPPQTIDLRASMITTVDDLLDEIKYQIFQNDTLRGAVEVSLVDGRVHFETTNKGQDVSASDFVISEGATGTLTALGISDVPLPARHVGAPIIFPFIVVPGFNDTIIIDVGPSVSLDGTDPDPVIVTVPPGIYNNINQIANALNAAIQSTPALNGAVQVSIQVPNRLVLSSVNTGSGVHGEDLRIGGPLTATLGWTPGYATHGGGTEDGGGIELEPNNIFNTLITLRDDCTGTVGPYSELLTAMDENGEMLGLLEGDIVTVEYDAGVFTFRILAKDTFEDLVENIQEIMGTRAKVRLTGDGRVEIENLETHQLADLRISAESATGEARTVFNAVFSELASSIPGLTKVVTRIMTDPTRYLRLGDEDIVLIDHDQENLLRYEAIVGARANRLGTILNLFAAEDLNVKELKNATEAANYAEVLTTLSQQELILQSSLAVGARVLPPSLLDFLV